MHGKGLKINLLGRKGIIIFVGGAVGDSISSEIIGAAVGRDGSMAVVEMAANPFGAHQVSRHMADREGVQLVGILDIAGHVVALNLRHLSVARSATHKTLVE